MFDKILSRIPENEPDLKIGSLSMWITGYVYINQMGQGDNTYLRTPSLLITENMIVFSGKSDIPVFEFKHLLKNLLYLYDHIATAQVLDFAPNDSEFSVKLSNDLGQIRVVTTYRSWSGNDTVEFEERIDQSYLPKIIRDVKIILAKGY